MPQVGPYADDGGNAIVYPIDQIHLTSAEMANQTQTLITNTTQTWQMVRGSIDGIEVTSVHDGLEKFSYNLEHSLGALLDYRASLGKSLGGAADHMAKQDQAGAGN